MPKIRLFNQSPGPLLGALLLVPLSILIYLGLSQTEIYRPSLGGSPARVEFQNLKLDRVQYIYRPDQKFFFPRWTLKTNSLGLVDSIGPDQLDPSCRNIIVAGSSNSLGLKTEQAFRFSDRLRHFLSASRSPCYNVLNISQAGYSFKSKISLLAQILADHKIKPFWIISDLSTFDWNADFKMNPERFNALEQDSENSGYHLQQHGEIVSPDSQQSTALAYFGELVKTNNLSPYLPASWKQTVDSSPHCPDSSVCINQQPLGKGPNGVDWAMRFQSPIFFSPKFNLILYNSLLHLKSICTSFQSRCTILELDTTILDLQRSLLVNGFEINLDFLNKLNLERESGQSMKSLFGSEGIGDDFHISAYGHDLVFRAIVNQMEARPETPESPDWRAYEKERQTFDEHYLKKFDSRIDFVNSLNTHQVVSLKNPWYALGPRFRSQEAVILSKKSCKTFSITGVSTYTLTTDLKIQTWEFGGQTFEVTRSVDPGLWRITVPCRFPDRLAHIQITCLQSDQNCQNIRLSAFESQSSE